MNVNHLNIRYLILKKLEEYVYYKVHKRLSAELEKILERQDSLTHSYRHSFWYRGEMWVSLLWGKARPGPGFPLKLHEELHHAMDIYIEERNHIRDVEGPLVVGFLRCILNHSKDAESMLSLIPVALQDPVLDLLQANLTTVPTLTTDEVAVIVKAPQNATEALKLRMMRNMMEG